METHHHMKKMKNQWEKYQETQMYPEIYLMIHQKALMKHLFKEGTMVKKYHVCLKASREDNTEVTSLTYDQIFKLSIKLNKDNDKLDKRIIDLKEYI